MVQNVRPAAQAASVCGAAILLVFMAATTAACRSVVSPTVRPDVETVDVLDFIIGAVDEWPRVGDQALHQVVDWNARQVCWVKRELVDVRMLGMGRRVGLPSRRPRARRQQRRILSFHGRPVAPPRAMPRSGVWTMDVPNNRIRWFTASCAEIRGPQGIRVDSGPNLFDFAAGVVRDARCRRARRPRRADLASAPHAPGRTSASERFYMARGAARCRWDGVLARARFDRKGGPNVALGAGCRH
jgi:hypothetical protein